MSGVVELLLHPSMAAGILQQSGRTSAFSKPGCGDAERTRSDTNCAGMSVPHGSPKVVVSPAVSPPLKPSSAPPTRKPFSAFSVDSLIGDNSRTKDSEMSKASPSPRTPTASPVQTDRLTEEGTVVSPAHSLHKHSPFMVDGLLGKTADPTTTAAPTTGLFAHPYLQARVEATKWQASDITFSPWLSNPTFTPPPRKYDLLLHVLRGKCITCALVYSHIMFAFGLCQCMLFQQHYISC